MDTPVAWTEKINLEMLNDVEFPVMLFKNKPEREGFVPLYTNLQHTTKEEGK